MSKEEHMTDFNILRVKDDQMLQNVRFFLISYGYFHERLYRKYLLH